MTQLPDHTIEMKNRANRLLQQGIEQLQTIQLEAAKQFLDEANKLYEQINDIEEKIEVYWQFRAIYRLSSERLKEGEVLYNLGDAYFHLKQFEQAIECYQEGVTIFQLLNHPQAGEGLIGLGKIYNSRRQFETAVEYYRQALRIFEQIGNFQKFIECCKLVLPIFRELEDSQGEAHTFMKLGIAHKNLNQGEQAIEFYDQALTSFFQLGNFQRAIECCQQILPIFKQMSDRQGEAKVLIYLGIAHENLKGLQQPIAGERIIKLGTFSRLLQEGRSHEEAMSIVEQMEVPQEEVKVLGGYVSMVVDDHKRLKQAIEYYQQALSILQQIGDFHGQANTLGYLGNTYCDLSEYQQAIKCYEQALPIFQQIGRHEAEAYTLMNLGNAHNRLSQFQQAVEYYEQAVTCFWQLGNSQLAIECCQQNLSIFQQIGDRPSQAKVLINLSSAYSNLNQYQRAIGYSQQALPITRQIGDRHLEAEAQMNIGFAYEKLGEFPQTIEFYQQALAIVRQIGDRQKETFMLINLCAAYCNLGQLQDAMECCLQALPIFRQVGDHQGEAIALTNLGVIYYTIGQFPHAIENLQQAARLHQMQGDTANYQQVMHILRQI